MKALVKIGPGETGTILMDWEEPTIVQEDEVLIKNEWVGICGTDIGIFKGTVEHMTPVILGHELAGVVMEAGKNVTALKVGDRVTAETSVVTCGVCKNCQDGAYNVCKFRLGMGRTSHGAFREKICLSHKLVHKLPEGVSTQEAALCEPAAVAYHAVVQRAKVIPSDNVYVFGPGPIGILVAQCAIISGAKVTVLGLPDDHEKLKLCESFGCRTICLANDKKLAADNVDVVFECSGSVGAALSGLEILRPRGRYVQVGLFKKNPALPMNTVSAREQSLLGCYSTVSSDFENVLELLKQRKLNLSCLISGTYSLEDWKTAFAFADDNASIKVLIQP
jgi:L-iditol 2-dehydrogenase